MTSFDIARKITNMPGLKVEASIDPTLISTRVKKMAQKMIRTGVLTGGYRSVSRMLATQLLGDACIGAVAAATKWGVAIHNATITRATKAEIVNLLEAARMIEMASKPESNHPYITARYKEAMKIERNRHDKINLSCYVLPICQQIAELLAASRTAHHVEASNKLADLLDGTEPIKANIFHDINNTF